MQNLRSASCLTMPPGKGLSTCVRGTYPPRRTCRNCSARVHNRITAESLKETPRQRVHAFGSPRSGWLLNDKKWSVLRSRHIKWLRAASHFCVSEDLQEIAVGTSTNSTHMENLSRTCGLRDVEAYSAKEHAEELILRAGRVMTALRGPAIGIPL